MLTDRDLDELLRRRAVGNHSYKWAIREAVRLTAERCADLVEQQELLDPSGLSKREQLRIYDVILKCAAAIRERIKDKPGWFDPNHHGRLGI